MNSNLLLKLIHILSSNSRVTTKYLGKELHTSQQNVSYLLKKAQQEGIISSFETLIDPSRFGYESFIVLLKIKNSSKRTINKIEKIIMKNNSITGCYLLFGNFEILLKFTSYNTSSFNKSFKAFLKEIEEVVIDFSILTQIVEYNSTPSYISSKRLNETILNGADRSPISINPKESKILELIQDNSRVSSSKIALSIDTTAKTVISLIKKLEHKEIIKGNLLIYHPESLGIEQYLLFLRVSFNEEEANVVKFLKTHPNITKIIKVFGNWDMIVQFETFNSLQLQDCLETIKDEFKILNYQYITITKRFFYRSMPLLRNLEK